ncbi:MarR family winged helix-turn-helix transcriptional regulator [Streptomyces sp. NPDC093600]|uniref:MarR family winged helix-turn-helix transcriptional regulator n=1 Tax=Streptomyces sp. NPDC093600 TaxID=3366047 RepID=UPI0038020EC6
MSPTSGTLLTLSTYVLSRTGKDARARLAERLARRGLRLWHATVLSALDTYGAQVKGELAARLDIHTTDLARVVGDLAKAGYVTCAQRPEDRRLIEVALTPEGRSALTGISAELTAVDDDLLAPLSAAERLVLESLLRRLFAHICRPPGGVGLD